MTRMFLVVVVSIFLVGCAHSRPNMRVTYKPSTDDRPAEWSVDFYQDRVVEL